MSGDVRVYDIPSENITVQYDYSEYPFRPWASPVILHDINSEDFKVKMFEQVLQGDGTYVDGLPTELGVRIVNEILSVVPMYWGV